MKTKSSKRNLRYRKEDNRWEWTTDKDWDIYYCTNNEGEGIFCIDCVRNDSKQLLGTLQFSVSGLTDASAKRKIREYMKRKGEYL